MFNSKMKNYDVYTYEITTNEYNEKIKTPVLYKTVPMFISLLNHTNLNVNLSSATVNVNDVNVTNCTYVAITQDKTLKKDMIIDNRYTITFVLDSGRDVFLTLSEVQDG